MGFFYCILLYSLYFNLEVMWFQFHIVCIVYGYVYKKDRIFSVSVGFFNILGYVLHSTKCISIWSVLVSVGSRKFICLNISNPMCCSGLLGPVGSFKAWSCAGELFLCVCCTCIVHTGCKLHIVYCCITACMLYNISYQLSGYHPCLYALILVVGRLHPGIWGITWRLSCVKVTLKHTS